MVRSVLLGADKKEYFLLELKTNRVMQGKMGKRRWSLYIYLFSDSEEQ
jgi:hypothetical protein